MIKTDLARLLSEKIDDLTKAQAAEYVELCLDEIKKTLENGENVLISGFGKFNVRDKKARRGRDPHSGGNLLLAARRVVTFKPSTLLKELLNQTTEKKK